MDKTSRFKTPMEKERENLSKKTSREKKNKISGGMELTELKRRIERAAKHGDIPKRELEQMMDDYARIMGAKGLSRKNEPEKKLMERPFSLGRTCCGNTCSPRKK